MTVKSKAWETLAIEELRTTHKLLETDGRKVMVLVAGSQQHDGATITFVRPVTAQRIDVVNFIVALKRQIDLLAKEAGVDEAEYSYIVSRPD